jgi:hypothetical protein
MSYIHATSVIPVNNLFLAIQISKEVIAKRITRVVEPHLLINFGNLLEILAIELEVAVKIGLDALRRLGFRQHDVTLRDTPGECNLRTGLVVFLANLDEDWIILLGDLC